MEDLEVDPRILGVIRTQRRRALARGGCVVSSEPAAKRPLLVARPLTPTAQEEAERAELAVAKVPKLVLPECEYSQEDLDAIEERHDELTNLKRRCLWLMKQTVVLETERKGKKKKKKKNPKSS